MSRQGLFADPALAQRIESTDAWVGVESARIHEQLHPESGATWIPVPGGFAIYTGTGSAMTQVLGLGTDGPVREEDLEEIEEFYRFHGANVSIELCPLADRSVIPLLAAHEYNIAGFSNMLVRRLSTVAPAPEPIENTIVRHCTPTEGEVWARTILEGFSEQTAITEDNVDVLLSLFHQTGSICLLALVDGKYAGGGALSVHESVAAVYGATTIPAFRRRGIQTALIQALLAEAVDARCDVAYTVTEPGSVSNRNLARQEFRLVYTRVKVRKTFS